MAVCDIDVLELLDLLSACGADPRIAGGWGVDALAERHTRVHRDLDLLIRAESLDACLGALTGEGFVVSTNWLPIRIELDDGVRFVDLHPAHYAADGSSWQAGPDDSRVEFPADSFTSGLIAGRSVTCLSVAVQLALHRGYPPRTVDLHDLALLNEMLSA